MTAHTEYALGCASVAQVLNLPLAVSTSEARRAECLVTGKNGQILDLIAASIAAVRAVVADERTVAEKQEIRIGVEQSMTLVATEAV